MGTHHFAIQTKLPKALNLFSATLNKFIAGFLANERPFGCQKNDFLQGWIWGGGGTPPSSGIRPPADPKGPPFGTF